MSENPYTPPSVSVHEEDDLRPRLVLRHIPALLAVGITGGVLLGTLTSGFNAMISPQFYHDVLDVDNRTSVQMAAVKQGMFEGATRGLAYAGLFVGLIFVVSDRQCPFGVALRYGLVAVGLAFAFWCLGGISAVAFAKMFPEHCPAWLFGYHASATSLTRYAWVRGSVQGLIYGGLVSVVLTNGHYVLFYRERRDRAAPRDDDAR